MLIASIRAGATDDRQLLADIGLAFATLYAAIAMTNYFIQLVAVGPSISSGNARGLEFLAMTNPSGLFIPLEGLGYLLQQVSMLFVAFVLLGRGLNRWIRWSLLGASAGCWLIAAVIVAVVPASALQLLGGDGVVSVGADRGVGEWPVVSAG